MRIRFHISLRLMLLLVALAAVWCALIGAVYQHDVEIRKKAAAIRHQYLEQLEQQRAANAAKE